MAVLAVRVCLPSRRYMIGCAAILFAAKVPSTNRRKDGRKISFGRNVRQCGQLAWLMIPKSVRSPGSGAITSESGSAVFSTNQPAVYSHTGTRRLAFSA